MYLFSWRASILSIVVPVYNEEKNIPIVSKRLIAIASQLSSEFEIIFSMDPSTDDTELVLKELSNKNPHVKYLIFSRRVGQPMSTLAGLAESKGDAVVVIDADLQDPPELILEMYKKWQQGFDVVYAQRKSRKGDTLIKRFISHIGYKVINKVADVEIPPNTGDYRLMSRRVVDEVINLKESHGFLRGMVAFVGFSQTSVQFERPDRVHGQTHYNALTGSLKIGFNGIFCFSNQLLVLSTIFGFVIAGVSFTLGVIYATLKLSGVPFPLGNPTIVVLILFLGGVQLITVGILGEYIGRIYDEVKGRPKYIIDKKVGF